MKVLVFTTQYYRLGGAEGLQLDLARQLNARGIHADVLSLYRPDLPGVPEATDALRRAGVPAVHFLGLQPHPSPASLLSAAWRLRRLVAREGYDIVETSGPTPTVVAMAALQGTRVVHVAGIHQLFRVERDTNASLKVLRSMARLDRRVRYYGVSRAAATAWSEFAGVSPDRVHVVYNSVSDDFFAPSSERTLTREALGVASDARLIVYMGRLAGYKGIRTIFDAVSPILRSQNAVLAYVGDVDRDVTGSADEVEVLRRRTVDSDLQDRVLWLGHRTDASAILQAADLLVHPTSIEAFGLVLVEALAAGVPIVASNVEGIPEILAGTDALMVSPGDAAALRAAVEATLDRASHVAETARERGAARATEFRRDRRIDDMVRLFRELSTERN
jgi:glycosyltransferase involved in cell wall biosynthesis